MKELTLKAVIENLNQVMSFVSDEAKAMGFRKKNVMLIELAADEIFSNIAFYAYKGCEAPGDVEIQIDEAETEEGKEFRLTFSDSGIPYDPLSNEEPDITLSAEEREIGGLGIFLVRKKMDDVQYRYEDGKNRLLLIKKLKEE